LVRLALERYPVTLSCTSGDVEFEDLLRLDDFLALALLAAVLLGNDLAGSLAITTGNRFLGDETGADLAEDLLSTWES
jgi:hypothetical protein